MEQKEQDIQKLCEDVLNLNITSTGDSGTGGICPFCYIDCKWDANNVREIEHYVDCAVLIAKDLSTNL